MIYDALIVPTETPPTLREIKRALLTYDQVLLIDPSDRELFPRQAFFTALMGVPLFGMDMGPVRPMGKRMGYDDRFDRTLEICKPAVSQNSLKVISTFTTPETSGLMIGGVPLGGYPLNPAAVYQLYRALASSQDLLTDVIGHDADALKRELNISEELAMTGGADGSVNDGPSLPIAEIVANEQLAEPLTQIARARIGAILKYSGYCEAKSLVPVFGAPFYTRTLGRILNRARVFLDAGTAENRFRRNRVLDLAHEEFLVDERLDALSVDDVLRLRSAAWGHQAVARERLFEAIFEIAESSGEDGGFLEKAANEIQEYRRASEGLVRERESLGMSIKCDIGIGALGGGVGLVGLMSQIESPLQSIAVTLAAGGVWALDKAKEYVPKLREIQAQTADLKRGAGFALHDFYDVFPNECLVSGGFAECDPTMGQRDSLLNSRLLKLSKLSPSTPLRHAGRVRMPIAPNTNIFALPAMIPGAVEAYNTPGTNTANYNITYNAYINARTAGIAAHGNLRTWIAAGHACAQIHGLLAAFGMNVQGAVLVPAPNMAHTLGHLPAASIDWIERLSLPLDAAPCMMVNPATHQDLSTELCALFTILANPGAVSVSGGFVVASKTLHCLFPNLAPMIDGRHSGISYFNINRATYNPPLDAANWNAWLGFPLNGVANPSPRGAGRHNWDAPRFMAALGINQHIYELWQAANGYLGLHPFLAIDPAIGTTGIPRVIDKLLW